MSFPYTPPPEIVSLLRGRQRFWLATHVHPDLDGFGSMLALGMALSRLGKDVAMAYAGDGPEVFCLLPGFDRTVTPAALDGAPEVLVVLDCRELERIGPVAGQLGGDEQIVVIDHHAHEDDPDPRAVEWVVEESAATCCLVQSLLHALDPAQLDVETATCLYAGLLTDTGGFRFGNTTSDALAAAADLVRAGADPAHLAETFLHRRRPETLRLLAQVLDDAHYELDGQAVLLTVTQAMLESTGGRMTETEGFVNFFTSADGVRLVAMFKEDAPERWRVSLRANEGYHVHRIARSFGGGGHRQAAGFEAEGPLTELRTQVIEAFAAELASAR
jgi:phosphoesterase RecJ-like protein